MVRFCCLELASEYGKTIDGSFPNNLDIKYIQHCYDGEITHTARIYYCPFCGKKLQNLGKTLEELKNGNVKS